MSKTLEAIFLIMVWVILFFFIPEQIRRAETALLEDTQEAYKADYLAWEIRNFGVVDASVLPSADLIFDCYDGEMNYITSLAAEEVLDFTPYRYVIFIYGKKSEGICLE